MNKDITNQKSTKLDWIDILLLIIPLLVSIFIVADTIANSIVKGIFGGSLLGIDAATGAMTMIVSWLTIPIVISRGHVKI